MRFRHLRQKVIVDRILQLLGRFDDLNEPVTVQGQVVLCPQVIHRYRVAIGQRRRQSGPVLVHLRREVGVVVEVRGGVSASLYVLSFAVVVLLSHALAEGKRPSLHLMLMLNALVGYLSFITFIN